MANWAAEIRIRAERKLGEMLKAQRAAGGMRDGGSAMKAKAQSHDETELPPKRRLFATALDIEIDLDFRDCALRFDDFAFNDFDLTGAQGGQTVFHPLGDAAENGALLTGDVCQRELEYLDGCVLLTLDGQVEFDLVGA